MERFIQYLDILEDAYFVVALLAERIRRILLILGAIGITAAMVALGVALALNEPPIGFAVAALLTVTVLYRSATANITLGNMPQ
jgi:hypothetical protein